MTAFEYYRNELRYLSRPRIDGAVLEVLASITEKEFSAVNNACRRREIAVLDYPKYAALSHPDKLSATIAIYRAKCKLPMTPVVGRPDEWVNGPRSKGTDINIRCNALHRFPNGKVMLFIGRASTLDEQRKKKDVKIFIEIELPWLPDKAYPLIGWFTDTTYRKRISRIELEKEWQPNTRRVKFETELFDGAHAAEFRQFMGDKVIMIPAFKWDFDKVDWVPTKYYSIRPNLVHFPYTAIYYIPEEDGYVTLVGEWDAADYVENARKALYQFHTS